MTELLIQIHASYSFVYSSLGIYLWTRYLDAKKVFKICLNVCLFFVWFIPSLIKIKSFPHMHASTDIMGTFYIVLISSQVFLTKYNTYIYLRSFVIVIIITDTIYSYIYNTLLQNRTQFLCRNFLYLWLYTLRLFGKLKPSRLFPEYVLLKLNGVRDRRSLFCSLIK